MPATQIKIASIRQLFLDDHLIEKMDNVHRQFHRPRRREGNPVVEPDRPWEQGGNGIYLFGGTVLFDEEDGLFKMWYRTSGSGLVRSPRGGAPDAVAGSTAHVRGTTEAEGEYKSCYAVSRDGTHWRKPELGLSSYQGTGRNNVLPPSLDGRQFVRRPNLIKDYEEPDPERRYKMVYMDEIGGRWGLSKGYSPDGIHWRMNVGRPSYFQPPAIPNGVLFGWDPRHETFAFYHSTNQRVPADVDGRTVRSQYAIMRSTSPDFEHWGNTREAVRRRAQDPPRFDFGHVGVLAGILYTDDLYVGFADTCVTHWVEDVPPELWDGVFSNEHAEHRTELVMSRDGVEWTRVAPSWAFMRPGLWGSWDETLVGLTRPLVIDDEILIYYTGRNLPCGAQIPGHPLRDILTQGTDGRRLGYAIGLARMRLDGFASMEAYEAGGTLTTRLLTFEGNRLLVNARAPEKPFGADAHGSAPHGALKAELLDEGGQTLSGYSYADCDGFTGDDVRHIVTWTGNPEVGRLEGKPVRVRFSLRNAALYSFQFAGEDVARRPISIASPGARGKP